MNDLEKLTCNKGNLKRKARNMAKIIKVNQKEKE